MYCEWGSLIDDNRISLSLDHKIPLLSHGRATCDATFLYIWMSRMCHESSYNVLFSNRATNKLIDQPQWKGKSINNEQLNSCRLINNIVQSDRSWVSNLQTSVLEEVSKQLFKFMQIIFGFFHFLSFLFFLILWSFLEDLSLICFFARIFLGGSAAKNK